MGFNPGRRAYPVSTNTSNSISNKKGWMVGTNQTYGIGRPHNVNHVVSQKTTPYNYQDGELKDDRNLIFNFEFSILDTKYIDHNYTYFEPKFEVQNIGYGVPNGEAFRDLPKPYSELPKQDEPIQEEATQEEPTQEKQAKQ